MHAIYSVSNFSNTVEKSHLLSTTPRTRCKISIQVQIWQFLCFFEKIHTYKIIDNCLECIEPLFQCVSPDR